MGQALKNKESLPFLLFSLFFGGCCSPNAQNKKNPCFLGPKNKEKQKKQGKEDQGIVPCESEDQVRGFAMTQHISVIIGHPCLRTSSPCR